MVNHYKDTNNFPKNYEGIFLNALNKKLNKNSETVTY